jgi:hypothetical protein
MYLFVIRRACVEPRSALGPRRDDRKHQQSEQEDGFEPDEGAVCPIQ